MASEQTKILVTGVTGFMFDLATNAAVSGGSVLAQIIASPDSLVQNAKISVVVRDAEKAKVYEQKGLGVVVIKDQDDADAVTKAAADHDVAVNCLSGFATTTARALVQGLGERKAQTGKQTSYIHLSGTSNLADFPVTKKYVEPRYPAKGFQDDEDIDAHERYRESLEAYPQRTSDVVVIDTGLATGVRTHIIMPPSIWGKGAGDFHTRSMQMPALCRGAIKARQSLVVGSGDGIVDHVHVLDLAQLFALLLQAILHGEKVASGKEGFYFCEVGHHSWKELGDAIGRHGKELGFFDTAEVKHVSLEEGGEYLAGKVLTKSLIEDGFALTAITHTGKAQALGWKPRYTTQDFFDSARDELQAAHDGHE